MLLTGPALLSAGQTLFDIGGQIPVNASERSYENKSNEAMTLSLAAQAHT